MKFRIAFVALAALMVAPTFSQIWDEHSEASGSNPRRRLEYWYEDRRYPFDDVPPNVAYNAWLQKQEMEAEAIPGLTTQSTTPWEFFGPSSTSSGWLGRVHAIAIHPTTTSTLYIGSAKGGVWKSTNSGTNWTNLTDTLPSQVVGCLTLDPNDPETIYFGTGEEYFAGYTASGVGIFKSTNGGATWTLFGNSTFAGRRINEIVINKDSGGQTWVVSCDAGIYRTTNGGLTFVQTRSGLASGLVIHPTNPQILYCAIGNTNGSSANGVYKSIDGGATWTLQAGVPSGTGVGRIELDLAKSAPDTVYAMASNPSDDTIQWIYKTTNGGSTWAATGKPTSAWGQCWYDMAIGVSPVNPNVLYAGDVYMYRSTNGGTSWSQMNLGHPDMHDVAFVPGFSDRVYIGQDAGLFYTSNGGTSWSHRNSNRGTKEYYEIEVHPTDPGKLIAGAQDNSTQLRNGSNANFSLVIGGDGFQGAYHRTNPLIMLGEYQNGGVSRSTNGGANWSSVFNGQNTDGRSNWNTPLIFDYATPDRAYIGTYRVWRSTSSGASGTWSAISPDLTGGGTLKEIAPAPSTSSTIYTGSSDGRVYVTINDGLTWNLRTTGLPNRSIGGFAVDPTTPSTAYVALQGYGSKHVYRTTNAGTNWGVYDGNLPDAPVNGLTLNPLWPGMLFAASDVGVFMTRDGVTWSPFGTGLPNTWVSGIRANGATGYLTIGTYGRGTWRTPLPANFQASGNVTGLERVSTAPNMTVQFQFFTPGGSTPLASVSKFVPPAGTVNLGYVELQRGNYEVRIKAPGYLAKRVAINASSGIVTNLNASLIPGDVDGDNSTTIFDYIDLSNAFDTSVGDSNYSATADLDGDGTVTIFDYIILSTYFDLTGDN